MRAATLLPPSRIFSASNPSLIARARSSSASFLPVATLAPPPPAIRSARGPADRGGDGYGYHQRRHRTQLVETYHYNETLRSLILEVSSNNRCSAPHLLERDGDWTEDQLWPVLRLLVRTDRADEALQVFSLWINKEISRINIANYSKIIRLLSEECLMDVAVSTFDEMVKRDMAPSLMVYNDIIHGFACKKDFDSSRLFLRMMVENGSSPTAETFNGLIQAYGNHGMYDEISKCVKRMESEGCSPNEVTYNILIGEFARGGLLDRMEGTYRTLLAKRMNLQPSTLVMMLEAYADVGVVEKMERVYRQVVNSKAFLKESLIRKLATVYIENYRYSRLEELGNEINSWSGRTYLVWCILLLSSACLLSRKGIESLIREMERAQVKSNITLQNILALFYTKTNDFSTLDALLAQIGTQNVKPDIMTFGILFDACQIGFDGTRVLETWRRNKYLEEEVEMKTDPLVLTAFGKGYFIRSCERVYSSLGSKEKRRKLWTYSNLIRLVFSRAKDRAS